MEGRTHYIGGSIGAIVGFIALKENGLLLDNIHPVLQFGIIYPFGIYGGMLPDADHHAESSPLRDPVGRVFNRVLNIFNKPYNTLDNSMGVGAKQKSFLYKLLSILRCSHRSWQTHSELTLIFLLYNLYRAYQLDLSNPNVTIFVLMLTGLTIGIVSHLILDMLTTSGINFAIGKFLKILFPNIPMITTIRLVPPVSTFSTGSNYELTVRSVLNVLQFFALGYVILLTFGYKLILT